jgi:transketolase
MFSIKPIDIELVDKCARDTGAVVTVEEHNILGGLGSAVSETSAEMYPVPIIRLGIRDKFGESARDEEIDTLLEKYGLSPAEIARTAIRVRSGTRR